MTKSPMPSVFPHSAQTPASTLMAATAAWAATLIVIALGAPGTAVAGERVVGSGRPASEVRSAGEFQSIRLGGSIDLVVRQGAATQVTGSADDNLLPLLETLVEQGTAGAQLVVRWKSGANLSTKTKVQVLVVTPRLKSLSSVGSGDMRIESFSTPALRLSLSGSGDATLPGLKTEELQVELNGSSDIKADGQAARVKLSIAGSGDAMLRELRADEVSVSIAGSGDAAVHAQKKLTVTVAGSGNVTYSGEPEVTRSVAGSGSVKPRR